MKYAQSIHTWHTLKARKKNSNLDNWNIHPTVVNGNKLKVAHLNTKWYCRSLLKKNRSHTWIQNDIVKVYWKK